MKYLFLLFAFFFLSQQLLGQVQLTVRIDNGSSSTTCTDGFFGGSPEPHWRVNIASQGWTTYPRRGGCFTNPPNQQYNQTYNCANRYPAQLEVCFRAFEDDGSACIVSESCRETNCQLFATPALGSSVSYTLSVNGSSSGTVNFTISATGSFSLPGSAYNTICNAVNLGTLTANNTIGNQNLSNFGNFCADNLGEPNPWGGDNDQGVWFQFTTSANPSAVIEFDAKSDPQNRGNDIDLQLALYQSSNNNCTGTLTLLEEAYNGAGLFNNEDMSVNCLQPNSTYFLLVDGQNTNIINNNGQEGYFGLEISDNGVLQAGDLVCDAEFLGLVPIGGAVATPSLSRSNICASNAADPNPGAWAADKTVWFRFQAPPSGHVLVTAHSDLPWPLGTDAIDLQLAAYSSSNSLCSGTLTHLGSDYTPGLFDESLELRCLTPGENYWIMVDGSPLNIDGIFDINIQDGGIPPAVNDLICDAIPLGNPQANGTVGLHNQNNYCADNLFEPVPHNWGNNQGVWYTFVAPPSGKIEVRLDNGGILSTDNIDLQAAVYDLSGMVCTGIPTEIKSQHQGIGLLWDETMEVECLTPGREYWVLVDGEGSLIDPDLQAGIFDIEIWGDPRDPPAPNDAPCNAIALGDPTGGAVGTSPLGSHGSQNNFCATANGEPQPSQFTADQTVWYTFVAPSTGNVNIQLTSDDVLNGIDPINLQIAVYETSSCTGPFREQVSGDDLIYDVDLDVFCLNVGQTYYVQIDGSPPSILQGEEGYFDINISEIAAIPIATNDSICNAIALGNPWAAAINISNQHNRCADDLGDPNPSAFSTNQTVWYTFSTPTTGGPFAVNINATSSSPWPLGNRDAIDLQLAVYQSSNNNCSGSLTEVQSEHDLIDLFDEAMRVQCLEENTTYFLMVDGSFIDVQGYFDLSISPTTSVPIPTNNMICQHENLGTLPQGGSINNGTNYFNYCADTENGEPNPFSIEQTVWFSFVTPNYTAPNATANVRVKIESDPTNQGDDIDLQLAVYHSTNNSCTGTLQLVEDGDDDPLLSYDAQVDLTCLYPNTRYWVQVDGSILNPEGYFQIEITDRGSGQRPPYNMLCNAVNLGTVPNGGQINNGLDYFNLCADTETGEANPNAFSIQNTVWFSFVAPSSGNVQINALSDPHNLGDDVDLELAVYYSSDNTCTGTFLEVDSDYDAFNKDESLNVDCLEAGRIYWLQVDGNNGLLGDEDGYFTLQIQDNGGTSNFPYNNDICNAYNFGAVSSQQSLSSESNICANTEIGEPGVGGYATHTVWYQFIAPASGRVEIEVVSTNLLLGIDPEVRVFSSSNNSCTGNLSRIETSNLPTALLPENIEAYCLLPGNTYFIQVDGSGLTLEGTFDIDIQDQYPNYGSGLAGDPQPTNNICDSATTLSVQASSCLNASGTFQTMNYGYPTITYNPAFTQGCGGNCGDTWYQFTMPLSGNAVIEGNDDGVGGGAIGDFSDLVVATYTGSCNNLSPISCDQGGLFDNASIQVAAPAGTTIWVQVFNDDGDDDGENYQICVSEGCGYDDCLAALNVPIQPNIPYCFNTAGAGGENIPSTPGYNECSEGDSPEHSLYYYFVSDCNGSDVTLHVINAIVNGNCILGITPSDGFNISLFQDATPCDANPDTLVDCQQFTACDVQPINWSQTYTGLRPNTPYIIQIDGGFGSLGGDNSGQIMITTTTNPILTINGQSPHCSGLTNGRATPIVQGGLGPFSFQWSNGQTDSVITGLAAGTYYLTTTGANGCTDSSQIRIDSTASLTATIANPIAVNCAGNCNGQATVIGLSSNPNSSYTYLWDAATGNQNSPTATGLCAGTYSVTVYDNNGCFDSTTATISSPPPLVAQLDSSQNTSCANSCDARAYLSANGGSPNNGNYTYQSPNGQNTAVLTGLCAGTYPITVSDANGCQDTLHILIQQPLALAANVQQTAPIFCRNDTAASLQVSLSNGQAPYRYTLYHQNGFIANGNNPIFSPLWAANYGILVEDANGCQDSITTSINAPNPLGLQLISSIDLTCNNSADGQINIQATGGISPYQYAINGQPFSSNNSFQHLAARQHIISVKDTNNCLDSILIVLNEPQAISLLLQSQTIANCGACDAGVSLSANGGTAAYTYLWSSGQTVPNPNNLCAGNQSVTLSDANGCSSSLALSIQNTTNFVVQSQIDQAISCYQNCDGAISIRPPLAGQFSYQWNSGQTTAALTGLCTGTYTVTVSDTSGCFVVETIVLTEPNLLTATAAQTQAINCNNSTSGQATVTALGGTAPYTYLWDNSETTATATALTQGLHTVTISDQINCLAIASTTINAPVPLAIQLSNINGSNCGSSSCSGTATATLTGGTTPYTYLWNNGNTTASPNDLCPNFNSITISDANGCTATASVNIPSHSTLNISISQQTKPTCYGRCDARARVAAQGGNTSTGYTFVWSNGQTTATASALCAGNYTVTVADTSGCTAAITLTIAQGDSLAVNAVAHTPISCFGAADGRATTGNIQQGQAPYTYLWSNGQTTAIVSQLDGSLYQLTLSDANGCSDTTSIRLLPPSPVMATIGSSRPTSCWGTNDGQARVTAASGGSGLGYQHHWSNGQTGQLATSLSNQMYYLTVSDNNGCLGMDSVWINSPPALVVQQQHNDVACFGDSTGTVSLQLSGGVPPYRYLWFNGATSHQLTGLAANAHYLCTLTDANGCAVRETVAIGQPSKAIQAFFTKVKEIDCAGQPTGLLEVMAQNGAVPYIFAWSNNIYTSSLHSSRIGGLGAGTYSLTITDNNGCSLELDTLINNPVQLRLTALGNRLRCFGEANGQITMNATGGNPPYHYYLKDSSGYKRPTAAIAQQLRGGDYLAGVQDANGCSFETRARVGEPDSILLEISADVSLNFGDITHLFVRMPINAPDNPVVSWSPTGSLSCSDCYQPTAQPFEPTTYTVSITGDDGCVSRTSVFVDVNTEKTVYIPNAFSPNNDGNNDVFMLYSAGAVESIEEFMIFDRWGELIVSHSNGKANYPAYGWDGNFRGKEMNTGVFVYFIKVRYLDGKTEIFQGDLTLIR